MISVASALTTSKDPTMHCYDSTMTSVTSILTLSKGSLMNSNSSGIISMTSVATLSEDPVARKLLQTGNFNLRLGRLFSFSLFASWPAFARIQYPLNVRAAPAPVARHVILRFSQ